MYIEAGEIPESNSLSKAESYISISTDLWTANIATSSVETQKRPGPVSRSVSVSASSANPNKTMISKVYGAIG